MVKKYAVVVGCNYKTHNKPLKGCINDAKSIHNVLIMRFGFIKDDVLLLTDDEPSNPSKPKPKPTASHIKWLLRRLLSKCKDGDMLFFFFSGHGTVVKAHLSPTGKAEEAIVGSDFNFITCPDFRKILNEAPTGVQLVFMSDSCHSGGLIDTEKVQIGPQRPQPQSLLSLNNLNIFDTISSYLSGSVKMIPFELLLQQLAFNIQITIANIAAFFLQLFGVDASIIFQNVPIPRPLRAGQVIMLSGCQQDEFTQEKKFKDYDGKFHGAFIMGLLNILKKNPGPMTNRELVLLTRKSIQNFGLPQPQHPCLYCSDKNLRAFFLFEEEQEEEDEDDDEDDDEEEVSTRIKSF